MQGQTFFFPFEVEWMQWLQESLGAAWISVLSWFSLLGEEILLTVVLGFLYWGYNKQLGKRVGLTVLFGIAWAPMLKNVVLRRRPYFDHKSVRVFRAVDAKADLYDVAAQGYSFPSMHAANSVTTYGTLAVCLKKGWLTVLAVLLPLLVGLSRVVVGVHYPTDVLAGWTIGLLVMALITVLQKYIKNTGWLYAVLLVLTLPGLFFCRSTDYFTGFGLLLGFMAGTLFEEKKVNFKNTASPIRNLLRVFGGVGLYLALNTLLKLPFPKEFLESGDLAALLVRGARYAVIAFVAFGVYPMLFLVADKWWAKHHPTAQPKA